MKQEPDFNLDITEINFPDTIELDDDIDFSVADFSIVDEEEQTRIIKPKMAKAAIYNKADFQYARDLASKISLEKNTRTTCIVPGNFIFGDLPEALVIYRGIDLKTIYCSTLSLSENNVDSFNNLLLFRNVEKINLMLSGYFYSHYKKERFGFGEEIIWRIPAPSSIHHQPADRRNPQEAKEVI